MTRLAASTVLPASLAATLIASDLVGWLGAVAGLTLLKGALRPVLAWNALGGQRVA